MRKAKIISFIVLFVLLIIVLVSCGKQEENVKTPGSTDVQTTTEPEKSYAFLESSLCQEVDRGLRHNPYSRFRHTPNSIDADPLVPVQIEKPKTVMINGKECAVGKLDVRRDRTIGYEIETEDEVTGRSRPPVVHLDVVTGKIVGIFRVYLDTPNKGESLDIEEAYLVRAKSAVAHHFPDVGIEQYVVDFSNMTAECKGLGSIEFVKKIDRQCTSSRVRVSFEEGKVICIQLIDADDFNNFDTSLLDYDKEEHTQLIDSFAEYVCNGYEPQSVERAEATLVKTVDGNYAMEYKLRIEMDVGEERLASETFFFRITLQ